MSKQNKKVQHRVIHPHAEWLGAVVLTAVSALVSFEAIIEHSSDHGNKNHDTAKNVSEMFVREVKGETSRLPEEFDIGLQTPHIAGL
jgi:hypothetical protein